jgi:hypothetical protein
MDVAQRVIISAKKGRSTLGDDQPAQQDPKTGAVIDFYGPCGEDPLGKDQVEEPKLIELHQYFKE